MASGADADDVMVGDGRGEAEIVCADTERGDGGYGDEGGSALVDVHGDGWTVSRRAVTGLRRGGLSPLVACG